MQKFWSFVFASSIVFWAIGIFVLGISGMIFSLMLTKIAAALLVTGVILMWTSLAFNE